MADAPPNSLPAPAPSPAALAPTSARGDVAADLARPARVVGASLSAADLEVFFRDPDLACVVLRGDDGRIGLVTRARLAAAKAGRFGTGRTELMRGAVGDIADWAPLVVAPETPVAALALRAMERARERRYDDVVVGGERWGTVSPADLTVAVVNALADPSGHDPLTRLPGRIATLRALTRRCDLAARTGARVALVLLDVRDMAATNSRYGLAAGDAVLLELASRILAAVPDDCDVGRVDGDRFAVLASLAPVGDLQASASADGLRQRVVGALAASSGGIPASAWPWLHSAVAWSVAGGADPEDLVLQAEGRLRRAKQAAAPSVAVPAPQAPARQEH